MKRKRKLARKLRKGCTAHLCMLYDGNMHSLKTVRPGGRAPNLNLILPMKEMANPATRFGVVVCGRVMKDRSKNAVYIDLLDKSYCLQVLTSNEPGIKAVVKERAADIQKAIENGADPLEIAKMRPREIFWDVVQPFISEGRNMMASFV